MGTTTFDVAHRIRESIITDRFPTGEFLPSEFKIAEAFKVGRNAVREAVAHLISEGLLRIVRGKGTRVLSWIEHGGFDLIHQHLSVRFGTPAMVDLVRELLWLRRALYTQLPSLVTSPPPDPDSLTNAVWNIRTGNHFGFGWKDLTPILKAEEEVLCAFAAQTGNLPVKMLTQTIRRMLAAVADTGPRIELMPASERFMLLATEPTPTLLDELCRLREQTYLDLATPKQDTATEVSP